MRKAFWGNLAVLLLLLLLLPQFVGCSLLSGAFSDTSGSRSSVTSPGSNTSPSIEPADGPGSFGTPLPGQPMLYLLPLNDNGYSGLNFYGREEYYAVIDQDGNEILRGKNLSIIHDLITGAPMAIAAERFEKTGTVDEYGFDKSVCYSALYDTSGQLLHDWQPGVYLEGFGNYIIMSAERIMRVDIGPMNMGSDFWSALCDMNTREVLIPDVYSARVMENGTLYFFDANNYPLCSSNQNLQQRTDFSLPEKYLYLMEVDGSHIVIDSAWNYILTDSAFRPLTSEPYNYIQKVGNEFVAAGRQDAAQEVIRAADGAVVYTAAPGESVNYYDGDVLILSSSPFNGSMTSRLCRADGTILADGFAQLSRAAHYDNFDVELFFGLKDNLLVVLDKTGSELAQLSTQASYANYVGDADGESGAIVLSNRDFSPDGIFTEECWMLDFSLNTIIPQGQYASLYTFWEGHSFLIARKVSPESSSFPLVDILSMDGTVLLEDIRNIYSGSADRLVVQWGFWRGLVDFEGNWVYRTSSFNTLED